jgi:hypothetical protein
VTYPVLLGRVRITTINQTIRFVEGVSNRTATIAAGSYYLRGDGSARDLLKAIVDAMNAAPSASNTYSGTLVVSADKDTISIEVTITRATGSDTFSIAWANAATTLQAELLGFPETDTANDAADKVGTLSPRGTWVSTDVVAEYEQWREAVVGRERVTNGRTYGVRRSTDAIDRELVVEDIQVERATYDGAGADPEACAMAFTSYVAGGQPLEFHLCEPDTFPALVGPSAATIVGVYVLGEGPAGLMRPARGRGRGVPLYDFTLPLMEFAP